VKEENGFMSGKGALSGDAKTYADAFTRAVRDHESNAKRLQKEQREVKESHETSVERRRNYVYLRSIMQAKMRVAQAEARAKLQGGAGAGGGGAGAGGGSMSMAGAAVDGENFMRIDENGGGQSMVINAGD
jgi:hypothetical protein